MISLFYHRKNRNVLKICEDSLTASIFDLLKYLPSELFYKILRNSLLHDKLPRSMGDTFDISFWEKWNAKNTSNANFVEPDVFIRYETFDIILEAKRYDYYQQYEDQMRNQIIAYKNVFSGDDKDLYFIQLGGIHDHNDEDDYFNSDSIKKGVIVCKTTWSSILNNVVYSRNTIAKENSAHNSHHLRILDDIIIACEMHQFYKLKWLDQLYPSKTNLLLFPKLDFLKKNSYKWLSNIKSQKINNHNVNKLFRYAGN